MMMKKFIRWFAELYKIVCSDSDSDTSINVTIPAVMIPQSARKNLKDLLDHGARGKYIQGRP